MNCKNNDQWKKISTVALSHFSMSKPDQQGYAVNKCDLITSIFALSWYANAFLVQKDNLDEKNAK